MKKGKLFATLAVGAVATVGLASCGSDKVINFYCSAGNTIVGPIQEKVDEFNKNSGSDYKIKIVNPGDYDILKDKVKKDLKVKNQPAIAYCYPDHVAEYLDGSYADKVIDLKSRFIDGDADFANIDFIDNYYDEGKIFAEGKLYTLPFVKSTEAMYVNVDMIEAAGVNLEELETWEGIFKDGGAADKIKAKFPDVTPFGIDSSDNLFITLCEQYGIPYTQSADNAKDCFLFNNDKAAQMLASLNAENKAGMFTTRSVLGDYTSTFFTDEKIAISIGSTGGANHQDPKGAFEYKVLPYPHKEGDDKKAISQGPSLVMFEQSSDELEDLAWQFIKTLFSDDLQAKFCQGAGYMPVTESAYTYKAFADFLTQDNIIPKTINMAYGERDNLFVSPAFNGSNKARTQVGIALNAAVALDASGDVLAGAKAALAAAYEECIYFV